MRPFQEANALRNVNQIMQHYHSDIQEQPKIMHIILRNDFSFFFMYRFWWWTRRGSQSFLGFGFSLSSKDSLTTAFYSIGKWWLLRQECILGYNLDSACFCFILGWFCCVVGVFVVGGSSVDACTSLLYLPVMSF